MVAANAKLGWRFGLAGAFLYLLLAFLIWLWCRASGSGEAEVFLSLFTIPAEGLFTLLAPSSAKEWFFHSPRYLYLAFGAAAWYILGWLFGRLLMFYRDHS